MLYLDNHHGTYLKHQLKGNVTFWIFPTCRLGTQDKMTYEGTQKL